MAIIGKFLNSCEKILSHTAFTCFISLVFVVTLQIVSRLFLPWVFAWTEELSRFLFIIAVCAISPAAFRHNEFVFVDFLLAHLRYRYIVEIFTGIVTAIFIFFVMVAAVSFMKLGYVNTSAVLKVPMWIMYSMPFISFLFLFLFLIEKIIYLTHNKGLNG